MEFLELGWVQVILYVVGALATLFLVPNKIWAKLLSLFGEKLAPIGESIAKGIDGLGVMAQGAGLEKIATAAFELSDVIDEAADVPQLVVDLSADGELSQEDVKKIIEATGEVVVEGKDFYVKVIKKQPQG